MQTRFSIVGVLRVALVFLMAAITTIAAQQAQGPAAPPRNPTPANMPLQMLEAWTRAYAKIIDEVDTLPLSMFQRPEEAAPASRSRAQ